MRRLWEGGWAWCHRVGGYCFGDAEGRSREEEMCLVTRSLRPPVSFASYQFSSVCTCSELLAINTWIISNHVLQVLPSSIFTMFCHLTKFYITILCMYAKFWFRNLMQNYEQNYHLVLRIYIYHKKWQTHRYFNLEITMQCSGKMASF